MRGGGGVKKGQKSSDVIYGQSLTIIAIGVVVTTTHHSHISYFFHKDFTHNSESNDTSFESPYEQLLKLVMKHDSYKQHPLEGKRATLSKIHFKSLIVKLGCSLSILSFFCFPASSVSLCCCCCSHINFYKRSFDLET